MAQDVDVQLVGDVEDELNQTVVWIENFQTLVSVGRRCVVRRDVSVTDVGDVGAPAINCRWID